ncbi:Uncharacterised protein [uncultured archaeon]|nr:Uncharacterised protein [uncultured archaeon]
MKFKAKLRGVPVFSLLFISLFLFPFSFAVDQNSAADDSRQNAGAQVDDAVQSLGPQLPQLPPQGQQANQQYGGQPPQQYSPQGYAPQQGQGAGLDAGGFGMGNGGFDMGIERASYADQEYVALQTVSESMTSAYNWVASNSTAFVAGCKGDRSSLVSQVAAVIKQSGETSTACQRIKADADACTPERFCPSTEKGKLQLPPNVVQSFAKAGYDLSNLSLSDIDAAMIEKVCMSQFESQLAKQKAKAEEMKKSLLAKIPEFRAKCEEYKKQLSEMESRSFDFQFPNFNVQQNNYGPGPNQGPGQNYGPQGYGCQGPGPQQPCGMGMQPMCENGTWVCKQSQQYTPKQGCQGQQPDCGEGQYPACEANGWQCRQSADYRPPGQQGPPQNNNPPVQGGCNSPRPQCPGDAPSDCSSGNWVCLPAGQYTPPATQQDVQPQSQQQPTPSVSPPPEPPQPATPPPEPPPADSGGSPPTGGVVVATKKQLFPFTGLAVETSGTQETSSGSGQGIVVQQQGFGSNGMMQQGQQGFGGGQEYAPGTGPNTGPYGAPGQGYGGQGQQGPMGPGPGPEEICAMTDDELVQTFLPGAFVDDSARQGNEYGCRQQASMRMGEISSMKMNFARCKAEAAVNCAAKKDAAANCQASIQDHGAVAEKIVSGVCIKFGATSAGKVATDQFNSVLSKFYESDPALANQLGDTVEKTAEDQKNLGITSYIFGDGDYGKKLKARADKLKEIKDKLVSGGVTDAETLAALDEQARQLQAESDKFSNFFDVSRIGKLFGG